VQAFVFLHEALSPLTIVGTAIVVAGVYLANYKGKAATVTPAPAAGE
jgi:drug/metabolite transporter (DMT)-like permease